MPNLAAAKAESLLPHLNAAMAEFGIDTLLRTAAFAAQLAHESGEFRWMEEIWGPTSAQKRYEPQTDLSKRLGNSEAGDGLRFKGRGPIQLTGRSNYSRFGGLLGLDLIGSPTQAAAPEVAFRIAALFWKNRGLNEFAEAGDFREVTRRINGGFNGLEDRLKYYERAKSVLASGFDAGEATDHARRRARKGQRAGGAAVAGRRGNRGTGADAPSPARICHEEDCDQKGSGEEGGGQEVGGEEDCGREGGRHESSVEEGHVEKARPAEDTSEEGAREEGPGDEKDDRPQDQRRVAQPLVRRSATAHAGPQPMRCSRPIDEGFGSLGLQRLVGRRQRVRLGAEGKASQRGCSGSR